MALLAFLRVVLSISDASLGGCAAEINRTEGGPLRAVPFRPLFLLIFRTKPAKLLK